MNNTPKTPLSITPQKGLLESILARIDYEKVKRAHRKFVALVSSTVVFFIIFLGSIEYAIIQFSQSEFPRYASLIFTDGTTLLGYWHEFLYALTESFPVLSVALVCAAFGIVLLLVKNIIKNFGSTVPMHALSS